MWLKWRRSILTALAVIALTSTMLFQNCAKNGAASGDFSGRQTVASIDTPENLSADPEYIEKADVSQLVANRILTANFFISVFGPGITNVASNNIAYQAKDFGSGFSIYESMVTTACSKTRNPLEPCVSFVADSQTQSNIALNVRREAWRIRTCHSAVGVPAQLLFALRKIDAKATLQSLPAINDANLNNAYRLFFRAKPLPDNSLLDALVIVSRQETEAVKQWHDILLTLCLSPHWQVL